MSILAAAVVTFMLPGFAALDLRQHMPVNGLPPSSPEVSTTTATVQPILPADYQVTSVETPDVERELQNSQDVTAPPNGVTVLGEQEPILTLRAANDADPAVAFDPGTVNLSSAAVVTPGVLAAMRPNYPPQAKLEHRFWDKRNTVGFAVHGIARVADAVQSCVLLSRPGRREVWLPVHSCSGIAAYSLSMIPAQIGTSYLMHRRGHHQLERWVPYFWAAPTAAGIAVSLRAW